MKPTTFYIFILMLATCLAACSINDFPEEGNTPGGSGTLRIAYRVAGNSVQTRTTEAGVDALNENTVTRLDLFVSNGSTFLSFPDVTATEGILNLSDEQLTSIRELMTTNTTFYLVANSAECVGITTLNDLKATTTPTGFDFQAKQNTFVMDASYTTQGDQSESDVTITLELRRALAKIRFTIKGSATVNAYQFFNHADATHVLAEAETYTNQLTSMEDFVNITQTSPLQHEGGYVFYSYPNDWFNNTLYTQQPNGSYTMKEDAETGLHNGEPIVAAKQTYLLLRATYESTEYYYKIPVNHRLPSFSDKPTFTEDEYEQIHDLYRLKRNHLYDVAVTISGPGGTMDDPVVPAYTITINDWVNGHPDGDDGRYELPPDAFVEPRENEARHDSETHPLSSTSVILNEVKDLPYRLAHSVPYVRCFDFAQHDNGQQSSSISYHLSSPPVILSEGVSRSRRISHIAPHSPHLMGDASLTFSMTEPMNFSILNS